MSQRAVNLPPTLLSWDTVQELVLKPYHSHFTDQMQEVRGTRKGWTVYGLSLFWVRRTQTLFVFSFFGLVIFLFLTLNQNRKSPPHDDGWVEFSSSINPIWDKAVSHTGGIAEFLQQTTKKENWWHQKRSFPTPTPRENNLLWVILISSLWMHFIGGKLSLNEAQVPQSPFYLLLPIHSTMLTVLLGKWVASSDYWRRLSLFWLHYKV